MDNVELQKLLYIKKDYSGIKELLKNSNDCRSFNILGKIYLLELNIKEAYQYFFKASNLEECAYCKFLKDDIESALIDFSIIKDSSPFVNWMLSLINLINNNKSLKPTYFQIRNFYEQDLELLFKLNNKSIAQELIKAAPYLANFNKEVYKYIGRVLCNNGESTVAENMIKKSIDICFNDPESHFILGEIYLQQKNIEKAIEEYEKANSVAGIYLPAKNKLKTLKY